MSTGVQTRPDTNGRPLASTGRGGWCRAAGVRSLGPVLGSGLRDTAYLVRRSDGQVLQVSSLLHLVLVQLTADRPPDEVARSVSEAFGRRLSVEGLDYLVRAKLAPLGLAVRLEAGAAPSAVPRANPLLALRFRVPLMSARTVRRLAGWLAPLFWPPVVLSALAGLVAIDVALVRRGNLMSALEQVLATPAFLLVLFALLTLGAIVHETGHAAACRYGGGSPGVIGAGVYLVFPAFFTDVTDSYRLDRASRVRTDLGGLYFNVWCLLAAGVGYFVTGQEVLLLVVLLMHLEMVQQLVPTLRFDGYFVLADLAGVPDLFARVRPVLASLVPGRPMDPRVSELRPAARRLVIGWVVVVVPTLAAGIGWLAYHLPQIVTRTIGAMGDHAGVAARAFDDGHPLTLTMAVLSILLLALPLLGLAVMLQRIGAILLRLLAGQLRRARRTHVPRHHGRAQHGGAPGRLLAMNHVPTQLDRMWLAPDDDDEAQPDVRAPAPAEALEAPEPPEPAPLTAAAFTDEAMLGRRRPIPTGGWQRAVFVSTSGRVNPGPSALERRRLEMTERVRAPITGSRRVVVMSRKGGVGKTTLTLALGSTFATTRGDRVVAVDANPDAGNLAHRVSQPCPKTITDVLADLDRIGSYADLRQYTSQGVASRVEVLASDDDARISQALNRRAYHRVITLLDHYYNLILLDTGTGILDSANQGLLAEADQLVVVLRPALDGARAAALTLDWLSEHEYGRLVSQAVVVVNGTRHGIGVPLQRVEDHFAQRCSRVLEVPWDKALETGAQTDLLGLRATTRDALVEVAAAVADNFSQSARMR